MTDQLTISKALLQEFKNLEEIWTVTFFSSFLNSS